MTWKTWLKNTWEYIKYWEIQKETIFQKLFTYHLPSTSSLLGSKDLSGVSVIVTGSTSGVGLNTAKQLAMAGAHVIMACRNINAANKIASMWREEMYNSRMPNVEVMELDLVSISSVRRFADEWEQRGEPLDIHAEPWTMFTGDGIEQHMQVNHVAPALLTFLLLPSLLKAPSPRIINVSSVGHYSGVVEPQYWNSRIEEGKYNSMIAYGSSKLAHIMFLKVLASKLSDQRQTSVPCFAVHPGAVCTNLNDGARMNLLFMFDGTEGK
ncbi:Dehydrogenase/reductase SDR family member FEY [Thalictrum thalictroides]|uniref:Dehydrogenase/reductase SDR family member FEY n=1 Tax=Thalictrum thalictroides TaxID=46969 RepID=A0A7J6W0R7_THATH|nr:Dehydrogenase/reductase SDR family member FEY [Thalictrum thalictroides]